MPRTSLELATVVMGDVVTSRAQRPGATAAWLESLARDLDRRYAGRRLADFDFSHGDELQGLLHPAADPFESILDAALRARAEAPRMRWAVVLGEVEPGRGPATRRTGPAFVLGRETIELARRGRDHLLVHIPDPGLDATLGAVAPVLGALLDRLSDRQRVLIRPAILEGARQSEVADRLGIARATVSVAFRRADLRSIERLLDAMRGLWRTQVAALGEGGAAT